MHNADTQCSVQGREEPKGQRIFFFKFFLSCHKMRILFCDSFRFFFFFFFDEA